MATLRRGLSLKRVGDWARTFARFAETIDLSQVRALIVGTWPEARLIETDEPNTETIETLVAAADQFAALRALFVGDMGYDDCEISWIARDDVTPLLRAFPGLEGVRCARSRLAQLPASTARRAAPHGH
ncbi:hypothetical protein ABZ905_38305 [Streptomyces parvus]|uniref:hypothetical protein n=1 Tax=Streptomyces parvus TaxID=66428 RepID=UPI0033DB9C22